MDFPIAVVHRVPEGQILVSATEDFGATNASLMVVMDLRNLEFDVNCVWLKKKKSA